METERPKLEWLGQAAGERVGVVLRIVPVTAEGAAAAYPQQNGASQAWAPGITRLKITMWNHRSLKCCHLTREMLKAGLFLAAAREGMRRRR